MENSVELSNIRHKEWSQVEDLYVFRDMGSTTTSLLTDLLVYLGDNPSNEGDSRVHDLPGDFINIHGDNVVSMGTPTTSGKHNSEERRGDSSEE